jgi:hypothetical protein
MICAQKVVQTTQNNSMLCTSINRYSLTEGEDDEI